MKHGIRSFSYIIFYSSFFLQPLSESHGNRAAPDGDFYDFTDVDGICSSLTRLEADRDETDFPVKIRSEGSQQCVRQIVVLRHQRQILGHVVCFHQTERGICIRARIRGNRSRAPRTALFPRQRGKSRRRGLCGFRKWRRSPRGSARTFRTPPDRSDRRNRSGRYSPHRFQVHSGSRTERWNRGRRLASSAR